MFNLFKKEKINEKLKISSMKDITKKMGLKEMKDIKYFYVPLSQHIGKSSKRIIELNSYVKQYEKIGDISSGISSCIHSPVSGKIVDIYEDYISNGQKVEIIKIENDFKYDKVELKTRTLEEVLNLEDSAILEIIKESGIVGLGGAQFPTHIKYFKGDKKVETLILNAAECEPYLSADYTLISEYTENLFKGIKIVEKLLQVKEILIAIEDENKELVEKMMVYSKKFNMDNLKINILETVYPQGSELQLIKILTNKEIRKGDLPLNSGIIVSNISTIKAIYDALVEGKPLIERIVTISGEKLKRIGNYLVKIGSPLSEIMEKLEADKEAKIIFGGPMMGMQVDIEKINMPILKGTSGLLFLSDKINKIERKNCISCNACVDACPMGLLPLYFAKNYKELDMKKQIKGAIDICIECGACEFVCPSRVPIINSIRESKKLISKMRESGEIQ